MIRTSIQGMMTGVSEPVLVPIAVGELADKITILEIKSERIAEPTKLRNIRSELAQLHAVWEERWATDPELDRLIVELKRSNEALWTIEDEIRDCERRQDFGARFIELARSVYRTNDHRAELKRKINELSGSAIVEEKLYSGY